MSSIHTNIGKLYALSALRETLVFAGIIYLFLDSIDVTINQYFLILGLFSVFLVILEIPSGYLSDRWGRKKTLLLGSVAASVGMALWVTSNGFWQYLLGEVFWAVGYSCFSGTIEAMMYDTLLEQKKTAIYRTVTSRHQYINAIIQASVVLLSGVIATQFGLRATYWITLPFTLATIPVALSLVEPKRHKLQEEKHMRAILNIATNTLLRNAALSKVVLLSALLLMMSGVLMWSTQPYQTLIDFPLIYFGIPHSIALLFAAFFAYVTPKLERRVDDRLLLLLTVFVIISTYIVLGFITSLFGLAILLLGRSMIGIMQPVSNDLINRMTTSDIRATVLSVHSWCNMLFFAVATPAMGYWSDVLDLQQALLLGGYVGGVLVVMILVGMLKEWKHIPS